MTDSDAQARLKPSLLRELSESMFMCCICYDVLVDPTTLTCGHNVCRLCLASWYLESKQRECPECRQHWAGLPKVNITLRTTTERLFPEKVTQRRSENEASGSQARLDRFERSISHEGRPHTDPVHRALACVEFFKGVFVAVVTLGIIWYLTSGSSDSLMKKPVSNWSVAEVSRWLTELGPWTEEQLVPSFVEQKIDGRMLLALQMADVGAFFNKTSAIHQRAFNLSLQQLQTFGIKSPRTIWDFKTVYFGKSILLAYGLQYNPRTTFVAVCFLDYTDLFLPFVQSVVLNADGSSHYETQADLSWCQWAGFALLSLLLPYLLLLRFIVSYGDGAGWFTGKMLIASGVILMLLEVATVCRLLLRTRARLSLWQKAQSELRHYLREMRSYVLPVLFWNFIPAVVCNVAFYVAVYVAPLLHAKRFRAQLRRDFA